MVYGDFECGSPAQGGCHTHPKAFHAGRGGCHRIGCGQEEGTAQLWRSITADKTIGAELRRFSDAVRLRFGDDIVRAMLRAEGGPVETASVPRQHQAALELVSRTVHSSNRVSGPTLIRLRQSGSHSVRHSDTDGA